MGQSGETVPQGQGKTGWPHGGHIAVQLLGEEKCCLQVKAGSGIAWIAWIDWTGMWIRFICWEMMVLLVDKWFMVKNGVGLWSLSMANVGCGFHAGGNEVLPWEERYLHEQPLSR